MDIKRRKELINEWKNRHPEMGIISIYCKTTDNLFLDISKDTRADFNSNKFKLSSNLHPNKQLQKLWNTYDKNEFEFSLVKTLKYKNPNDDQTEKLARLFDEYISEMPNAIKLSK